MANAAIPTIVDSRTQQARTHQAAAERPADWRTILAHAVRDPAELCRLLALPATAAEDIARAARGFRLLVPQPYLGRIRPGDPDDPLLRQVLPTGWELDPARGFEADPLGESTATVAPGVLQKYGGRSLIVATPSCAVHCRFCFRRHFPYAENSAIVAKRGQAPRGDADERVDAGWAWSQSPFRQAALQPVAADRSIDEVILSGGDPLTLDDAVLADWAERIAAIPHVRRLRIHTRLPVVIPQRVTDELLAWLRATRLVPIVVVHVNHPAEVNTAVADALARLVDAGVPVLSQSVLLRGVNDSADVLAGLYRQLVDLRVMPYYLHQLDRVAGTAHFEVPVDEGLRIVEALRARLPGYAVPRYVREVPGAANKVVLG